MALSHKGLTRVQLLRRLATARAKIDAKFAAAHQPGNMYANGLAREGYDGGYLAALNDVEALLLHGFPSDERGYWREND